MNGELIELFDAAGRRTVANAGTAGTTGNAPQTPPIAVVEGGGGAPPVTPVPPERVREIRQGVLADVACVLARAAGADIEPRRAFAAARSLCEILFSHPDRPGAEIPKLFWETPLGQAVGACCGDRDNGTEAAAPDPLVKTTVHIPHSVRERLRLEAEVSGKSVSELLAEKLAAKKD